MKLKTSTNDIFLHLLNILNTIGLGQGIIFCTEIIHIKIEKNNWLSNHWLTWCLSPEAHTVQKLIEIYSSGAKGLEVLL